MWRLTDHVCQVCLGRVLERDADHGVREYQCADCGVTAYGKVEHICACGQPGLQCVPNDAVTPECPQKIVVAWNRG